MMRNNYHNPQQQSQDSVTKISRSKSRNQMSIVIKRKQKQTGWNDRFHLQQIPQYNYQNEPHSQYLKNKFRIPNRKNDPSRARRIHQLSLDKNKVSNKPNPRRNQEKIKEAISKAYSDLKTLWYEKAIPDSHMELMTKFFNRENNPMKIFDDIKQEFSDISKEISLVQKITSSIETRENCLLRIKELEKELADGENGVKIGKLFEEKVSHLRILTIHCIECIFQWKQSIQPLVPKTTKVYFKYQGTLYTKKTKEDYKQLSNSKFKELYQFDEKKIDAFFLNYTVDGKRISNVSKNLVKRIRLCEIMIAEDDDIQIENVQQQSEARTPMIQKLRSPPYDRKDRSMPPRAQTPVTNPWKKVTIQYGNFPDFFLSLLKKSAFCRSFHKVVETAKYQEITVFQYVETNEQVVLAVDKNASNRKIIIFALKSTLETIDAFLKNCCEYLWEHDCCSEIRMSLVHHQIGESVGVDTDLQKKLRAVGFRWLSVNHNNDQTMTIYGMKRPLNTVAHKSSKRTQAYPVIIQHLTVLNLQENNEKKYQNNCQAGVLSLFKHIQQQKKQEYEEICKRDQFSHHLQSLARVQDFMKKEAIRENISEGYQTMFTYSGLRAFQIANLQGLEKIFRTLEVTSKEVTNFPAYISLLNTSFKFRNTTITDGKHTKFFPSKDNEILICESQYPVYLLQTDEENINFFIIEVEENFSMESIDSIFHAMGEQSSFIDEFWLPTFKKSLGYADEVGMQNRELISTDYRNNLGSLTRKSKVRTKVIRAPFVFGMINKRLLEILEIPFYSTLVRKSDLQ